MLYSEVIEYLYQHLPLFQNQGASALKNGLDGIIRISEHIGNPHKKFKSIHIAGTNGKGSTSHMLASVLQAAGYKTGLYTSPHLIDFRERIRIDGEEIKEDYVVEFINQYKAFIDANSFSFFEVTVALAFKYFADNEVDIAIIEVGLGGRLDSTNIITPILSIITNISDDHKQILGETLPEIASEKAGIIKKNVPVVISTTQPEIALIFKEKAQNLNAEIYFADENFKILENKIKNNFRELKIEETESKELKTISLDLLGTYQQFNVLGVIQAFKILNDFNFAIKESAVDFGLESVCKSTGLMGRWQKLNENPLIICDTGHNSAGILEVVKNIQLQKSDKLHIVIGFVKDKDINNILKLLPINATYYFCNADIPRALEAEKLQLLASELGFKGEYYNSVANAFIEAKKQANIDDFIFIGGSTFVVADLLKYLQKVING